MNEVRAGAGIACAQDVRERDVSKAVSRLAHAIDIAEGAAGNLHDSIEPILSAAPPQPAVNKLAEIVSTSPKLASVINSLAERVERLAQGVNAVRSRVEV